MEIISAREFRANQTRILSRALRGESILLSSRIGTFKITPISEDDTLTSRISEGLREVGRIENGEIPSKSALDFLNEL
ncbi:MAG: prevent-host-death protein [Duncaniella sp.]|nr:prevent-host-death protein [Duncaniella sp.]